jgi:four helix bundle protein
MNNFRELNVWKEAMILSKEVFILTKSFPNEERYGLTSQVLRSVVSIPSNIAEGAGRQTIKDFSHFLNIALGSSYELETQVILAFNFGYITNEQSNTLIQKLQTIQKMIYNLIKSNFNKQ